MRLKHAHKNVDCEVNLDRDPSCLNDDHDPGVGEWVPCARSFVILIMDGEPNPKRGARSCKGDA